MFQNFLLKKMLKSKLAGVPEAEQEKIFAMIEKNPDMFKKLFEEVQEKVKGGMDQKQAMMEVAKLHENELKGIM